MSERERDFFQIIKLQFKWTYRRKSKIVKKGNNNNMKMLWNQKSTFLCCMFVPFFIIIKSKCIWSIPITFMIIDSNAYHVFFFFIFYPYLVQFMKHWFMTLLRANLSMENFGMKLWKTIFMRRKKSF